MAVSSIEARVAALEKAVKALRASQDVFLRAIEGTRRLAGLPPLQSKKSKAKMSPEERLEMQRGFAVKARAARWKDKTPPPAPSPKKKRRPKKRAPA
jgi:hypothetical protein